MHVQSGMFGEQLHSRVGTVPDRLSPSKSPPSSPLTPSYPSTQAATFWLPEPLLHILELDTNEVFGTGLLEQIEHLRSTRGTLIISSSFS